MKPWISRIELTADELHLGGEGYRVSQSRLEPVMRAANLKAGIADVIANGIAE